MWTFNVRLIALAAAALLSLAPLGPAQSSSQSSFQGSERLSGDDSEQTDRQRQREEDRERPRDQIFVKTYPIRDITGRQETLRLEQLASNTDGNDAQRIKALQTLQELEESGSVQSSADEVGTLIRRMMHPPFDPEAQHLAVGDGTDLLVSGNQMQHNSVRLLLRELRSDDRFIKLVVEVYELPPVPLPPSLKTRGATDERDLRSRYFSWQMDRVQELKKPTYERTVAGEIGRPIRLGLTRRVPIVSDYRLRTLVDSGETVLEPVVHEVVEGPVIEALIGRFQKLQLVVKAKIEHRSCRRPIPTRTMRMKSGEEVVVQVPEIDEVSGSATIHTGFDGPAVWLATTAPLPTAPRTDYFVFLSVKK